MTESNNKSCSVGSVITAFEARQNANADRSCHPIFKWQIESINDLIIKASKIGLYEVTVDVGFHNLVTSTDPNITNLLNYLSQRGFQIFSRRNFVTISWRN